MADIELDDAVPREEEESADNRYRSFVERFANIELLFDGILDRALAAGAALPPDPGAVDGVNATPWVTYGPRNIVGRIRSLAQDPRNASTIYAGTSQGGVFVTNDAGDTWRPLGPAGQSLPIGAIACANRTDGLVYVGTGLPSVNDVSGQGLWGTTGADRSVLVRLTPLGGDGYARHYTGIAVDPENDERCWIASSNHLWRRDPPTAAARLGVFVREDT